MKALKFLAWGLWFAGWIEIIANTIYLHNIYPTEFANKVKQECGQLEAERQDYEDAYEDTANKLNECRKDFVIKSEEANRNINSSLDDQNDNPDPTDPNNLDNDGATEIKK